MKLVTPSQVTICGKMTESLQRMQSETVRSNLNEIVQEMLYLLPSVSADISTEQLKVWLNCFQLLPQNAFPEEIISKPEFCSYLNISTMNVVEVQCTCAVVTSSSCSEEAPGSVYLCQNIRTCKNKYNPYHHQANIF